MNKEDVIDVFPDVCIQKFIFDSVLSYAEFEKRAVRIANEMKTGLIAFDNKGKKLTMLTSKKLYDGLQQVKVGSRLNDWEGIGHTVTSAPCYVSGEGGLHTKTYRGHGFYGFHWFHWNVILND